MATQSGQFDIKQESPYDTGCRSAAALIHIDTGTRKRAGPWVPSRFNARTTDADGSLILWNTLSGAISVFGPDQKAGIEKLLSQEGFTGELSAAGRYLLERGYLASAASDEYEVFQYAFGEQHFRKDRLELILLASEDCNFRCSYCYEDFLRGTMLPEVRQNIKNLVEKKVALIHHLSVSWFGGEPLYGYAAIEDLAPFFKRFATQSGWSFQSSMTTNGYLLTRQRAQSLLEWGIRQFQITLDGPAEQHNRSRPARDGSGTFHVIWANLLAMRSLQTPFSVRLRVNYDKGNLSHIEHFLDALEASFAGDERFQVSFQAVGKWGGPNDANLEICGAREADEVRARLGEETFKRGLNSSSLADNPYPGGSVCYAARPYNLVIGAAGQIMKCTVALDKDPSNVVGRLEKGGELALDKERFARWVAPAFAVDASCQKCHMLPVCQGISCPLIRFESGKSPCEATPKHALHDELVAARRARQPRGRTVGSAGAATRA